MGDFGRAGTASLWKSGPFFSTGTSEAKLMIVELRLNLRLALMRRPGGVAGGEQEKDGMDLAPSCPQHLQSPAVYLPQKWGLLSTALDDRNERRSVVRRRKEA